MEKIIKDYAKKSEFQMFEDLIALCKIPAPSHFEQKRAEYCKNWLENIGAKGVYIDEALNTVFPLNCENSNEIVVFAAHTTLFFLIWSQWNILTMVKRFTVQVFPMIPQVL